MATRYTRVWDTSKPAATDPIGYAYRDMQWVKQDIEERIKCPEWAVAYRLCELGDVSAGVVELDVSQGDVFTATLPGSGTVTFDIINVTSNSYDEKVAVFVILIITNPSSGAPTVAWSSKIKWAFTTPISPTSNARTIYQFITTDGGNTFIGMSCITGVPS